MKKAYITLYIFPQKVYSQIFLYNFQKISMPLIKGNTPSDHQDSPKQHRAYDFITFEDRIDLIEMILIQRKSIVQTAKELNVNLSTVKYIVKCFKSKGKVMEKFADKRLHKSAINRKLQKLKREYQTMQRFKNYATINKSQNPSKSERELQNPEDFNTLPPNNNNVGGRKAYDFNYNFLPNQPQMCYIFFLQPKFE